LRHHDSETLGERLATARFLGEQGIRNVKVIAWEYACNGKRKLEGIEKVADTFSREITRLYRNQLLYVERRLDLVNLPEGQSPYWGLAEHFSEEKLNYAKERWEIIPLTMQLREIEALKELRLLHNHWIDVLSETLDSQVYFQDFKERVVAEEFEGEVAGISSEDRNSVVWDPMGSAASMHLDVDIVSKAYLLNVFI
jgi:hypothetical protein